MDLQGEGSLSRCPKYLTLDSEHRDTPWHVKTSKDLLIQIEAPRGCSDADLPVLSSDHKQVHEVPMHLAVPRRWVPATHGEHFQTLQGLHKWSNMRRQDPPTRVLLP